jgi:flagella basal body P-ring formation protein FlgA
VKVLAVLAIVAVTPVTAAVPEQDVRQAILRAVEHRIAVPATVGLRDLVVSLPADVDGSVFATVPPDARAGEPTRVVLKVVRSNGRTARYGEATCVIDLKLQGLRTTRPVAKGSDLGPDDLQRVEVDAAGWALRGLPLEVDAGRAVQDIAAGQVVQRPMVAPAPLVRAGDDVTLTFRIGPVVVEGRGVAIQAGRLGDVIHVVNPDSKRRITARVSGRGLVEVQHGR